MHKIIVSYVACELHFIPVTECQAKVVAFIILSATVLRTDHSCPVYFITLSLSFLLLKMFKYTVDLCKFYHKKKFYVTMF